MQCVCESDRKHVRRYETQVIRVLKTRGESRGGRGREHDLFKTAISPIANICVKKAFCLKKTIK